MEQPEFQAKMEIIIKRLKEEISFKNESYELLKSDYQQMEEANLKHDKKYKELEQQIKDKQDKVTALIKENHEHTQECTDLEEQIANAHRE